MVEDRDQPVYVSSGIPLHMLHIFFDQVLQNLEEELRFIEAREGFAESPLMGYREDYSQYVPRGHYTASRRLEDYFRAMMWLGRLTFLLNGGEPDGPSETCLVSEERARLMTVSALLTVSDLEDAGPEGEALLGKWKRIYELTAFFADFVEPVPRVYAELNATLEMARRGLEEYGVLDGEIEGRFRNACSVMARLEAIAEGELAEVPMSREDAEFLKDFAFRLEATTCWGGETTEGLETSLIADVHTDQNSGLVLEAASGDLDLCIVIYRRPDGLVEAAVGPVLSYYEFTWPMSDRLTDRAWRDMLGGEEPPMRPSWAEVEGSGP